MSNRSDRPPIDILLVEDNPADARLTRQGLDEARIVNIVHVAETGEEALDFLYQRNGFSRERRPDLVLLDLNLPGIDGHVVLATIKNDEHLRTIPVAILTASEAEADIVRSYATHANCYVAKPIELGSFIGAVGTIERFWSTLAKLPARAQAQ